MNGHRDTQSQALSVAARAPRDCRPAERRYELRLSMLIAIWHFADRIVFAAAKKNITTRSAGP
jgi:hypothetical protein